MGAFDQSPSWSAELARLVAVAPVHSLPWYFGGAVFAVWAAAAIGFTLLVRRRLRAKAEQRRDSQRRRNSRSPSAPIRDDRSLGSGGDVEPW
jgi:hypothetical protein